MSVRVKTFGEIRLSDVPLVGGKNASLGEMRNQLSSKGIPVPDGFAVTAAAFREFLDQNGLTEKLVDCMKNLDLVNYSNLRETGRMAREMILRGKMGDELVKEIVRSYHGLCGREDLAVAVRSSATAEDLPEASFAGQHDSFLNIKGEKNLVGTVQKCFASLYTDRAIKYREDHGFDHSKIALSVGVQKMVRSDKACSGVAFTLEPESGFRDIVHISGVWGLGENLVQGTVTPDEFLVFKPTLKQGRQAIIQKKLGEKELTMVYSAGDQGSQTINRETPMEAREQFVLSSQEISQIAQWCLVIEEHYKMPMDIEWAKDGEDKGLYIIQARPETVHLGRKPGVSIEYRLKAEGELICSGQAVGNKVARGIARILNSPGESEKLSEGEIVVTDLTSPDWDPILKKAAAIITNKGGRTSHASIVARELGVPAVVGCADATTTIKDNELITVSCCEGKTGNVYRGEVPFEIVTTDFSGIRKPGITRVMLIVGDPDQAFKYSFYPNDGVGLMRMEFIINHFIQVHPMALVHYDQLKDEAVKKQIDRLTHHFPDRKEYFISKLAQGVATIAAAFYPKDVLVRMSDFKTNEYRNLIGGRDFEPDEENPMIGFRGASRYYSKLYREGFEMECAAISRVRREMGLENVKLMIPFCRTLDEAEKVIEVMELNGLDREREPSLKIYMMAEIPGNVLLADRYAQLFDGFSIGSNDLTQLTLGIDRDSQLISHLFNENDEAARMMIGMMINKARKAGVPIGLCGQAPSDYPQFAEFLVNNGITNISFNPDALLKGIEHIQVAETKLRIMASG